MARILPDETDAVRTGGDVVVDTVHRFRGRSADCVVSAGADFDAWSEDADRRLVAAITRARLKVSFVVSRAAQARMPDRLAG